MKFEDIEIWNQPLKGNFGTLANLNFNLVCFKVRFETLSDFERRNF